jgi:spore coat polysaccharide biosynthesis protein SpsF
MKLIEKSSVGIVIQVRSSSKRFKNKFRAKINHDSIILFLIKRILKFKKNIRLIIAIPNNDQKVYEHLKNVKNIDIFNGSKNDVLDRYYKCAKKFNLNTIVRLTGDNPLIDLNIMFKSLNRHVINKKKFTTNCINETFPNGFEFEIISSEILNYAWKNSFLKSEREHVTPYIYKMIRYNNLKNKEFISINDKTKKYSFLRLTIDKPLDLIVVRKVYNLLKKNKFKINLRNIIKTFKLNKKIFFMNQSEIRDEGYKKNILNEKR